MDALCSKVGATGIEEEEEEWAQKERKRNLMSERGKNIRREEKGGKSWEKWKMFYFERWKRIVLIGGSQISPDRPCHKGSVKIKMLQYLETVVETRAAGVWFPELFFNYIICDRLCFLMVRVSDCRYRDPGFDSQAYQIFWEVGSQERGPLRFVRTTEELLEWKSSGSGLESRD
jgi:hypothetical protein